MNLKHNCFFFCKITMGKEFISAVSKRLYLQMPFKINPTCSIPFKYFLFFLCSMQVSINRRFEC